MKRNMERDPCCEECPYIEESISHVFRDCQNAKWVWLYIIGRGRWHDFKIRNVRDWLYNNLERNQEKYGQHYWGIIFGVTL